MKKKEDNPSIKCDVKTCKYQDGKCNCCTLDSIKVTCGCGCEKALDKDNTICKSFKCDKKEYVTDVNPV